MVRSTSAVASALRNQVAVLIARIRKLGPMVVIPYHSFGLAASVTVRGRVLANPALSLAIEGEGRARSVIRMMSRFLTREVAGATVLIELEGWSGSASTDDDGYFAAPVALEDGPTRWVEGTVRVEGQSKPPVPVQLLVLGPDNPRIVISDIDDTLLENGLGNAFSTVLTTAVGTVFTRTPVKGTPEFYRRLHAPTDTRPAAPVFYVSSSPWNIYDFLVRFLDRHGFPPGPLQLRDFELDVATFSNSGHGSHKVESIEQIIAAAPGAQVLLLGDSSLHDAAAFAEVIHAWPDRIVGAFVRDVGDPAKADAVRSIAEAVEVPMELFSSADQLEQRIARLGWFS